LPLPIAEHPSANFGPRKGGLMPEMVVLHYTAMASAALARDRLCDPQAEVSAHYLISNTGVVEQLVPEEMRAWHAGVGTWRGLDDINSRSIGIELDNRGTHPFSEPQMTSLERGARWIRVRILTGRVCRVRGWRRQAAVVWRAQTSFGRGPVRWAIRRMWMTRPCCRPFGCGSGRRGGGH